MLIYLPISDSFAKKMIKPILLTTLLLSILFMADSSTAGIYRYVDENGVIHFTNCPRDPKFQLYIRESKEDVGVEPCAGRSPFRLSRFEEF